MDFGHRTAILLGNNVRKEHANCYFTPLEVKGAIICHSLYIWTYAGNPMPLMTWHCLRANFSPKSTRLAQIFLAYKEIKTWTRAFQNAKTFSAVQADQIRNAGKKAPVLLLIYFFWDFQFRQGKIFSSGWLYSYLARKKFNSTLLFKSSRLFFFFSFFKATRPAFLSRGQQQKGRNSSTILKKKRMQASTDSLDTMVVHVDATAASLPEQDSISQPLPAPDESINALTIPHTLNVQQEDNLSIDVIKLYQVGCC